MNIKKHRAESRNCPGGNELPIERDVTLAEAHLHTWSAGPGACQAANGAH